MIERVDAARRSLRISMHDELHAAVARRAVAHFVHGTEFPGGVDVQQWEGRGAWVEGLAGEMQHHGAVLAHGIQHHRFVALHDDFTHDVHALGFKALQMRDGGYLVLHRMHVRGCKRSRQGAPYFAGPEAVLKRNSAVAYSLHTV